MRDEHGNLLPGIHVEDQGFKEGADEFFNYNMKILNSLNYIKGKKSQITEILHQIR